MRWRWIRSPGGRCTGDTNGKATITSAFRSWLFHLLRDGKSSWILWPKLWPPRKESANPSETIVRNKEETKEIPTLSRQSICKWNIQFHCHVSDGFLGVEPCSMGCSVRVLPNRPCDFRMLYINNYKHIYIHMLQYMYVYIYIVIWYI